MKRISFEFLDANNKKKVKTDCRAVTSKKRAVFEENISNITKKNLIVFSKLIPPVYTYYKKKNHETLKFL